MSTHEMTLRLDPEMLSKIDAVGDTLSRIADNQDRIAALHEENRRLLGEVAGRLTREVSQIIECALPPASQAAG